MELLMKVNFYAWIGLAVSTALLIPAYWASLETWRHVWKRINSIYSISVVQYWLQRLESEGLATFERARRELREHNDRERSIAEFKRGAAKPGGGYWE